MLFADVVVDISARNLDQTFQYRVPDSLRELAVIGAPVIIPFGQSNRQVSGFIVGLSDTPACSEKKIKSIEKIQTFSVNAESNLIALAYWMKQNYGATFNDALKAVMPVRQKVKEKLERQIVPTVGKDILFSQKKEAEKKHYTARARLFDALLADDHDFAAGIAYEKATKEANVQKSVIQALKSAGLISVTEKRLYRNPVKTDGTPKEPVKLNEGQRQICEDIKKEYDANVRGTYLIFGVTGSGKTEVYMELIAHVLKQGKQVIVLIPEIALTYQTVSRFSARFGDVVSFMHSRLSAGERYDQYLRAKNGQIQIMIGPRSALFTPFAHLGLIVIDEEHDSGYRSDTMPRYHAREVAQERAKRENASLVLGSATPSLEAYYRCQMGEYKLFTLKKRAAGACLPKVTVVDLRQELKEKNYSVFSRLLQEKIEDRLQKKEQILLFLNRRGYAGFVSCRRCGEAIVCDHCSVAMKPHKVDEKTTVLKCHYCGAQKRMPAACPSCSAPSKFVGSFGLGTQQVETMLHRRFPCARVLRMDADTTATKGGHERILQAFSRKEADILLGTQMIVKGHDFSDVTLVGALAADLSLNAGDFRAAEHTFDLLAQVAGRAGRAEKKGEVIFQTYRPEHYSVTSAAKNSYEDFYRQEIAARKMLQYPPISHILEVLVFSPDRGRAKSFAACLSAPLKNNKDLVVLGPTDAPIAKLNDAYRFVFYVKSESGKKLCAAKDEMEDVQRREKIKDCTVKFTFD